MLPDSLLEGSGFFCVLRLVFGVGCVSRASTPQRDQSRPNRRAKHAAARPNHDRLRPITTESTRQARLSAPKHDQSRPITTESTRQARLSAPKHDRSRPIATESTRQSRQNRRAQARPIATNHDRIDATNRDRIDAPIDAPITTESRNRDRIDRIGRPPSILSCLASGIRSSFSRFFLPTLRFFTKVL